MMNIPTALTLLRFILAPMMVVLFILDLQLSVVICFFIAALTDWLDGFLARLWNQTSQIGAFLDQASDKILVACALLIVTVMEKSALLPAAIILSREFIVLALRAFLAQSGQLNKLPVSIWGKLKTCLQFSALGWLLAWPLCTSIMSWHWPGILMLWVATLLALFSCADYLRIAYRMRQI